MKILFWDIETWPMEVVAWGLWEQNISIDMIRKESGVICGAWKWAGAEKVEAVAVDPRKPGDDFPVIKKLHAVLSSADVLVAHNGDQFDVKRFNARAIYHGLRPIPPIPTVDTLKVAKGMFSFNSNKLDYLGQFLKVGKKLSTGGIQLWLKVMAGDRKALKQMIAYNKTDVVVLEAVYEKLRPYMKNHPNHAVYSGIDCCPNCGSKSLRRQGFKRTRASVKQQLQCQTCGSWCTGKAEPRKSIVR
jgi:hypothetical protein